MTDEAAILLVNPKFPNNVGGVLRAVSCFGASRLAWTGSRVPAWDDKLPKKAAKMARLPREFRLYRNIQCDHLNTDRPLDNFPGWTPVCVEYMESAENLVDFIHPERAVYVFGPEDGDVRRAMKLACHRFVKIPTNDCLNLAASVNVILYDRVAKNGTS